MQKAKYRNTISFQDILFNCLLVFVLLFSISIMNIVVEQKREGIAHKAEFIITVTWPDESKDDVDTWLENPQEQIVWFRDKEIGLMHLDRDDIGKDKDLETLSDGTQIESSYNQEITTIRGIIPGEWVLNIHMYSKRDSTPTEVHVRVQKLNPCVTTVIDKKIILTTNWSEVTIARILLTASGNVLSISDLPKKLVEQRSSMMGGP